MQSIPQNAEGDHGEGTRWFSRSDKEILELISATHVPDADQVDTSFDIDCLFKATKEIFKDPDNTIKDIVKGIEEVEEHESELSGKISSAFSAPLESFGCELLCKCPDDEIALESSALEILQKRSKYSWGAKALLALEEFALKYRESDQPGKSVAIFMEVPKTSDRPLNLQMHQKAVLQLNSLINTTVDVIQDILELEKLSSDNECLLVKIPVSVYWSIITTVACSNEIARFASREEKPRDLIQFNSKMSQIRSGLRWHLRMWSKEIDIMNGINCFAEGPDMCMADSMEVLRDLIFSEDNVQPELIDGSTNNTVPIGELGFKNMFLLFSSLNISDVDISLVKKVYGKTLAEHEYKIVWIPIVEGWTDDLRHNFEELRLKMPWYTVTGFSASTDDVNLIKEQYHFKGKPILVVMNRDGTVKNTDALPLIKKSGLKAWPFHMRHEKPNGLLGWIKGK